MINGKEEYSDNKLKDILSRSGIESPSASFTDKVMQTIRKSAEENAVPVKNSWFNSNILGIASLVGFSIAALIFFFYQYGDILMVRDMDPLFSPVLKDVYDSLANIVESIRISSVTVVIIGGFIFLLLLEHFLRKFQSFKNSNLIF